MNSERGLELLVRQRVEESLGIKRALLKDEWILRRVVQVAQVLTETLASGRKVLLCGNGGSAADAQHIAAELVGRYRRERPGLPALALTVNTSSLTAIGNDYSYEMVFARQIEALAAPGDVLIAISTSGNSPNVLKAVDAAKARGVITVGLTGRGGGQLKWLADHCVSVPAEEADRAQECHLLIGHIWCEAVERELFAEQGVARTELHRG